MYYRIYNNDSLRMIYIELGLQTVNYHTLEKINRGHDLAQFIDAVLRIKRYGFNVTTHMIVNLPWDTMEDTIEGAKILSSLGVDQVKLHALYIVKHTLMAKWYEEGQITLISAEEYAERVVQFLRYLHPDIVLQRLVGVLQRIIHYLPIGLWAGGVYRV